MEGKNKYQKFEVKPINQNLSIDSKQLEMFEKLQKDLIEQINKQIDSFIENILRNHVHPQIKGDITKGKIKWRGIKINHDQFNSKVWLTQRGIDIPIVFDYSPPKYF